MSPAGTIKELQSYIGQTRKNLEYYERRREHFLLQKERNNGESRFLRSMIGEAEQTIGIYRDLLKDLELKLSIAKGDRG